MLQSGAVMCRLPSFVIRYSVFASVFVAGCSDAPDPSMPRDTTWQYRPAHGYVNVRTMERLSPEELLARGTARAGAKSTVEAAAIYRVLADTAQDPAIRSEALYRRGETLFKAGAYAEAYRDFENCQARHPDSDYAGRSRQRMMDCALGLAEVGQKESVLGIPLIRTSKAGVTLLKSTLQRFPREEFSDDYYFKLAEFHHARGEWDETELELRFILTDPTYKRSNSAGRALLLLAQIGLERYDGVSYDHKSLADAKRAYEQFEGDYKQFADDPEKAAELGISDLPAMVARAHAGIAFVNERLAEREFTLAEYYLDRDGPRAAKTYLQTIVRNYPKTTWAARAGKRLKELETTP
jgi:tetratricopeptide (TPR) repeat protein